MIDFHSHILPNIDDGAKNIDETFEMIKEAEKAGFDGILLTPHYIEEYYETDVAEREVWLAAISQNLHIKNINTDLYLASEIFISDKIMTFLENAKASTINNTSYVMFELPLDSEPENLYNTIYSLTSNKLVPVLAHPERYNYVQKEPELIYDLINRGVLMQMNYGSIIGQYGKKAQFIAKKLLENNMIHFLGTDAHRENTIYPKIPSILLLLREMIGIDKLNELTTTNPNLALRNKRIDIEQPTEFELTLKEKIKLTLMK